MALTPDRAASRPHVSDQEDYGEIRRRERWRPLDPSRAGAPAATTALRLRGPLSSAALHQAAALAAARHAPPGVAPSPVAEVRFDQRSEVTRLTDPGAALFDLSGLPADDRPHHTAVVRAIAAAERQPPGALAPGWLRVRLARLRDREHVVYITTDPSIADEGSRRLLVREMAALYGALAGGYPAPPPKVPSNRAALARRQRVPRTRGAAERDVAFWRDRLRDLAPLDVSPDHARPPRRAGRGTWRRWTLPAAVSARIHDLARADGVTAAEVLLAAFAVWLSRHAGTTDVAVAAPVVIGPDPRGIGSLTNDLPIRVDCNGAQTFRALVRQVHARMADARAHGHIPFAQIVELAQVAPDDSRPPLAQVSFACRSADGAEPFWNGLDSTSTELPPAEACFDLTLAITERGGGFEGGFQCDRALYEPGTIARLPERWLHLLDRITSDADRRVAQAEVLPPAERARQILQWNETSRQWDRSLHVAEAIAAAAARSPDAVATEADGEHLTYAKLTAAARALSVRLRQAGVTSDAPVGVLLDRTPALIVAIAGILDADGAYVPLDPAMPADRLARIFSRSNLACLVTTAALSARVPTPHPPLVAIDRISANGADPSPVPPCAAARRDGRSLCYVLYTSGTTGEPKGVAVPHGAVANLLYDFERACQVCSADTFLGLAPLTFDIASLELLLPLICGARLVLAPGHTSADGADLHARITRHQISILQATPVTWRLLLDSGWSAPPGLQLLCGSEPLPRELARELIATAGHVWNCYGPTETTIYSTFERLASATPPITIGGPMANTSVYILDRHLEPVPIGVIGEIYIGGDGLARGYLGRPDLTAASFRPDPFSPRPGQRMYASGDLGRFCADGRIECRGRRDHQVKLHGRRIELEAIGHVLDAHPLIRSSIAIVRDDAVRGRLIVAYVTSAQPGLISRAELREHVARHLPSYMVPAAIVILERLPRTGRAKLDRRALPAPVDADFRTTEIVVRPQTSAEQAVAAIWREVLGISTVGVDDDFFMLGGNSLLAARTLHLVRARLGTVMSIADFFAAPTIAAIAAQLDRASGDRATDEGRSSADVVARIDRSGPLPLTAQQANWWRIELSTGNINPNNVHFVLHLAGPLQRAALEQALAALMRRHEAPRTGFVPGSDGQGQPAILPPSMRLLRLPAVDLSRCTPAAARRALDRAWARDQRRPFDLTRPPLWRLMWSCRGTSSHALAFTAQHLVNDARSNEVLMEELSAIYSRQIAGVPSGLPDLPFEFVDYVQWQRGWLTSQAARDQMAYWRAQLASPLSDLFPPTDADARDNGSMFSIRARVPWTIRDEILAAARRLSRRCGTTLFSVLTAALKLVLFARTAQPDIRIGTLAPNRDLARSDEVMGLFVNAVCLRTRVEPARSLRAFIGSVHGTIGAATAHQGVPFELLSQALKAELPPSGLLYQVLLIWLGQPTTPWTLPAIRVTTDRRQPGRPAMVMVRNTLQLRIELVEADTDVTGTLTYNAARFSADEIQALIAGVACCLAAGDRDPDVGVEALCEELRTLGRDANAPAMAASAPEHRHS